MNAVSTGFNVFKVQFVFTISKTDKIRESIWTINMFLYLLKIATQKKRRK
jgi:hypothetical protein